MRTALILALLVAVVGAVLLILRQSGPRVTQVRRERRVEDGDGKDRG